MQVLMTRAMKEKLMGGGPKANYSTALVRVRMPEGLLLQARLPAALLRVVLAHPASVLGSCSPEGMCTLMQTWKLCLHGTFRNMELNG